MYLCFRLMAHEISQVLIKLHLNLMQSKQIQKLSFANTFYELIYNGNSNNHNNNSNKNIKIFTNIKK